PPGGRDHDPARRAGGVVRPPPLPAAGRRPAAPGRGGGGPGRADRPGRLPHARRPAGLLADLRRPQRRRPAGTDRGTRPPPARATPPARSGGGAGGLRGLTLPLSIGPPVPAPAPPDVAEAVQSVSVTHNDEGRSGFQVVLQVGRAGPTDLLDYRLLLNPLLRPFNRVIMTVVFNAIPRVLSDGVITNQQFSPGNQPGAATLTLTGEDVSVMMDLEKKRADHPAQSEVAIAFKLIGSYAQYGLMPIVIPPASIDQPIPIERTPVQQGTDLEYLKTMG